MCFQEYIAYQCGHRSPSVARPCPMTTAGHNFPVCTIQPVKEYFAETMCAACERQMHSRWVLIREWEHRWLHERGACGCDVCFPGLLTTPRVIGDDSSFTGNQAFSGTSSSATAAGSSDGHSESRQYSANVGIGDGRIPALFSETVTTSGEHRVSIRIPSLYAAEWLADHRGLHAAGKCSCNADFAPFRPQIPDEELTPTDQQIVRLWQQLDAEGEGNEPNARDIDGQVADSSRRIAQITEIFGFFTAGSETPKVNLPPPTVTSVDSSQGSDINKTHEKGRRGHKQSSQDSSKIQTRRQVQPDGRFPFQNLKNPPEQQHAGLHPQPTMAYNPRSLVFSNQPFNNVPCELTTTGGEATALTRTTLYPGYPGEYPIYQHPQPNPNPYPQPANPYFATPATYSDTIPFGARPWSMRPQAPHGASGPISGPGPYWNLGLRHNSQAVPPAAGGGAQQQHHHQGEAYHHGYSQQGQQIIASAAPPNPTLAICGVPIGAGPEGESHMPSWRNCRLRSLRGESAGGSSLEGSSARYYSASECGGGDDEDKKEQEDEQETEESPAPPLLRRHSTLL